MEALSCILKRALQGGFLEGFLARERGGDSLVVSHLLFADDTPSFFYGVSKEHVEVLSWAFMWFEAVFVKINLDKSELIPVGWFLILRIWLGCKVGSLLSC